MKTKLNPTAFALAAGIVTAAFMLLLAIGANVGLYESAAEQMMRWHMFFSFDLAGIITGMIEAFIWTFAGCYVFVWLYNKLVDSLGK